MSAAYNKEVLRLVLLGKTGAGKSAAGNTILQREAFQSQLSSASWTFQCKLVEGKVGGRGVAVIDTPGLFDTNFTAEEVLKKIKTCMALAAPGPHAFLVVLRLGRFTREEQDTIRMIQEYFGDEAFRYSLLLFTHGDKLKKQSIESFVSKSDDLQELIRMYRGRYHVFNNQVTDQEQVEQLVRKVDTIVLENNGGHYTKQMYRRAKRASKKEKQRLRKEVEVMEKQRRNTLKAEVEREMNVKGRPVKDGKCLLQ